MGPLIWWLFIQFLKALPALLAGGSFVAVAMRDAATAEQVYSLSSSGSGGSFLMGMAVGGLIVHLLVNGKLGFVEVWKKSVLEWIASKLAETAAKIKPEGT